MPTTLKMSVAGAGPEYFDAKKKRFTEAIINLDQESAEQVTNDLLSAQLRLGDIYLRIVTPALVSIGELCCRGEMGVGAQQLATQIVVEEMDRLRAVLTKRASRSLYRVLICCVQGELHSIGARMIADLCLARSLKVDFLGPDASNNALINVIQERHPQVLALSMTTANGLAKARAAIEALERIAPSLRIVLGGQGVPLDTHGQSFGRFCEIARDALQGIETISKIIHAGRPSTKLQDYQMVLAHRVRELRLQNGWTQERLAEATRVTHVCIVAIEGAKQNVSMDILIRLSNALEVAPETLLSPEG